MFERFTERARHVVVLAQNEARALEHDHIGTEHLLIGLVDDGDGVAGGVLRSLGLTAEPLRDDLDARVKVAGDPGRKALDADALAAIGIDLAEVRRRTEEAFGPGALERPRVRRRRCRLPSPPGAIPFTPRAKKALELGRREAVSLAQSYIGTEHILLGLLREGEGVAVELLRGRGLTANQVRAAVLGELAA